MAQNRQTLQTVMHMTDTQVFLHKITHKDL